MTQITILGGGPAGLATAYFATRRGLGATLLEAGAETGGNCRTFEVDGFRFDSGAHRVHDRDPEMTAELESLLAGRLRPVAVPSHIYDAGRMLRFPLTAGDLLRHFPAATLTRASADLVRARVFATPDGSFESLAASRYGRTIAERFLLGYSAKLWGAPADRLSPAVAGSRLKGLDIRSFLASSLLGDRRRTRHVEGRFLYPRAGIGEVTTRLAEACAPGTIRTGQRVVRVVHDGAAVRRVETEAGVAYDTEEVVSTLPLPVLLRSLDPAAPDTVLEHAAALRQRQVRLVGILLDRPAVTGSATVYFPDPSVPFTRVSEPRNRSPEMAPPGRTSLLVELPCQRDEPTWTSDGPDLAGRVVDHLASTGWFDRDEVLGTFERRLVDAYPILELGCEAHVGAILDYLSGLSNLHLAGRNGLFMYGWIHDMMRMGSDLVDRAARTRS